MKVFAVGGKAFFHKDDLKALGFRWYREPKLWVKPESDEAHASGLASRLDGMNGVRWDIQDLPVEDMFRRVSPNRSPDAPNQAAGVSSLDRARAAAAKLAAAPEPKPDFSGVFTDKAPAGGGMIPALATALAIPVSDLSPEAKPDDDFLPELTRLRGRLAAMRMMIKEIEQDVEALAGRAET